MVIVEPYVLPGTNAVPEGHVDSNVIVWTAREKEGRFTAEYGLTPACESVAIPSSVRLPQTRAELKYSATLTNLELDARVYYRVKLDDRLVAKGAFNSRRSATNAIHFVAVGDTVRGHAAESRIAWLIWQRHPDFFLHLGDVVYPKGTLREYHQMFWSCYNNRGLASPESGAPIMAETPFYVTLGNHDVIFGLDLDTLPDGLAVFYFFQAPLNGPGRLRAEFPLRGSPDRVAQFREAAGPAFPALCFYSFDQGPVHFVCLDGNPYSHFLDPALSDWLTRDLASTRQPWKVVFSHKPAFQTALTDYNSQQVRWLAPILQTMGVDLMLSGHTHNYQRTRPLRFSPHGTNDVLHPSRVNGDFEIDRVFDGETNTVPAGVIHIVSGGGGARLMDAQLQSNLELGRHEPGNWVPYTASFVADRHSFSDITVSPERLVFTQIDLGGKVIDRFEIHKQARSGISVDSTNHLQSSGPRR